MIQKKSAQKQKDLLMTAIVFGIFILFNFVGSFLFKRFDLTSEKRYTLSESTKKLIKSLDDVLYLKVYLQGDFNPSFTRLKNETKELLDEYVSYSDGNIAYEFINPLDNPSKEETDKLEKQIPFIQQGYDIVGTKCVYFGELNGIVPDIPIGDFSNFNFLSVNPVINSSFVGKKELCHWNDYGIKDYGIEDYDLWLSLWKNNCSFYNCPEMDLRISVKISSYSSSLTN